MELEAQIESQRRQQGKIVDLSQTHPLRAVLVGKSYFPEPIVTSLFSCLICLRFCLCPPAELIARIAEHEQHTLDGQREILRRIDNGMDPVERLLAVLAMFRFLDCVP